MMGVCIVAFRGIGAPCTNLYTNLTEIVNKVHSLLHALSGDAPHDDWNRPAGRPRTSWMSQIVWDTGLTAADAWAVADDRSTWRALRPTAGYAQH